jgi:hypothetical protein
LEERVRTPEERVKGPAEREKRKRQSRAMWRGEVAESEKRQ